MERSVSPVRLESFQEGLLSLLGNVPYHGLLWLNTCPLHRFFFLAGEAMHHFA